MPSTRQKRPPKILDRRAATLIGPFGPLPLTLPNKNVQQVYMYSFSEVVMCEWVCNDGDDWDRVENFVIEMNEDVCRPFKPGAIRALQMTAWPCSISHNSEQDAGWAIDEWDIAAVTSRKCDIVRVTLRMAITGEGTRLNRIGYAWTAYVSEV